MLFCDKSNTSPMFRELEAMFLLNSICCQILNNVGVSLCSSNENTVLLEVI